MIKPKYNIYDILVVSKRRDLPQDSQILELGKLTLNCVFAVRGERKIFFFFVCFFHFFFVMRVYGRAILSSLSYSVIMSGSVIEGSHRKRAKPPI